MTGQFVITIELELLWGLRDHADQQSYGRNILTEREAVTGILDLFERHGIRATWATAGFVFCQAQDELMASLRPGELRPRYRDPRLSSYSYLAELGRSDAKDPHHLGASLVRRIREALVQEVGTHTLAHFYCLEDGSTPEALEADLRAALALDTRHGVALQSIAFPRNQDAPAHRDTCRRLSLKAFRGNPGGRPYRSQPMARQTSLLRTLRLADAHSGVLGPQTHKAATGDFRKVRANRFLRPRSGRLAVHHPAHAATIRRGMAHAAPLGHNFHLWSYPHNFSAALGDNLAVLQSLFFHFDRLRAEGLMVSRAMSDA